MLAHGASLRKMGFSAQQVIALLEDFHHADLPAADVHLMDFATKMSQNPPAVTQADIDRLREDGLTDQQITDIALVASVRNFISRFYDAMGTQPDPEMLQAEPELWDYLKDWHAKRGTSK